jgi:hypothetical protein
MVVDPVLSVAADALVAEGAALHGRALSGWGTLCQVHEQHAQQIEPGSHGVQLEKFLIGVKSTADRPESVQRSNAGISRER